MEAAALGLQSAYDKAEATLEECGVFDGAVSISAVQWLCVATRPEHDPLKRCSKFFRGLHAVLAPHARAALQVYPEEPSHMGMLRDAALAAGFEGGLVIDYPVSERSKKMFLVLVAKPRPLKPQRAPKAGGGIQSTWIDGWQRCMPSRRVASTPWRTTAPRQPSSAARVAAAASTGAASYAVAQSQRPALLPRAAAASASPRENSKLSSPTTSTLGTAVNRAT